MDPNLIASGISSAGGFFGQILANRKNQQLADQQRNWNEQMRNEERQWALDDWHRQNQYNKDLWNMQNWYNSPQMQMARLKQAGLNPHLMYGKGTVGNATSMPESSSMKSPDVKGYDRAQSENVLRGFNAFKDYHSFKNLDAQTDNVEAQKNVAQQNAAAIATRTAIEVAREGRAAYKHDSFDKEFWNGQLEAQRANLEKVNQDIEKGAQDLRYGEEKITAANLDNKMRAWEVELNKLGLTKTDNKIIRMLVKRYPNLDIREFVKDILPLIGIKKGPYGIPMF